MIKRLFDFWKHSKEQKAAKLAAKLIKVLDDLGRDKATNGDAAMISIYEYSHIEDELELKIYSKNSIDIKFNHNGKIIKR